jgi:hypothetical protein
MSNSLESAESLRISKIRYRRLFESAFAGDKFSCALLKEYMEQLNETGQDYLSRICAASANMAQLIEDLRNLSCLSRSKMRRQKVIRNGLGANGFFRKPIDLNEFVEAANRLGGSWLGVNRTI